MKGNIRVFRTLQEALDSSYAYPDHTYVHIVNDYGRLQSVLIKVRGQMIPLKIENEVEIFLVKLNLFDYPLAFIGCTRTNRATNNIIHSETRKNRSE